jgi:HK97 gp10 family phage protein
MPNSARIRIIRIVNDEKLGEQIEERMRNLGQALGARAQRLVPKRTWKLYDTIQTTTERRGSRVTTTVGAGGGEVDYALFVERGTSRMRAQPYLRPALMQTRGADLLYKGQGIQNHAVKVEASRQRRRDRAMDRRTSARENRDES